MAKFGPEGPDPIDVAVGTRIRYRRKLLGISQTELAQALGLTFQQVQKYERGVNRVSASMLVKTARKLECTVAYLVGEAETGPAGDAMYQRLATPGALDLLEAFARLPDGPTRRGLVSLARGIVAELPTRADQGETVDA